ncbi:MAG: right-handed parallel beta-helix repeat-containing protein [Planctomycetota bacterium]
MDAKFVLVCALGLLVVFAGVAPAGSIQYFDGGGTSTLSGSWDNLQTAITAAEGGGGAGWVKVSGDVTRTAGDTASHLSIATGGISVSGGWDAGFGTQSGVSVLDADHDGLGGAVRVMDVAGSNTSLDRLGVTGGKSDRGAGVYAHGANSVTMTRLDVHGNDADGGWLYGGGGMTIHDCDGVTISHSDIHNNLTKNGRGYGGGLFLQDSGTEASPVIIEYSKIRENEALKGKYGGYGGGLFVRGGSSNTIIANSRIVDNVAQFGETAIGIAYPDDDGMTIVNTLITGNRGREGEESGKSTIQFGGDEGYYWDGGNRVMVSGGRGLVLANSTVVDNYDGSVDMEAGGSYQRWEQESFLAINSILDDAYVKGGYGYNHGHSWQHRAYLMFQNSTLNLSEDEAYGATDYDGAAVGTVWASDLIGALALTDYHDYLRFHSLDATGAQTQDVEGNFETAPAYVGAGEDPLDPYRLFAGAPSTDSGLTGDDLGGGFTYVDINTDGDYDAMVDIVVAGTDPGAGHLVYMTDLLGNARLVDTIDRGAYESAAAPIPEPAGLSLLGLALLALRRRRS